MEVLVGQSAALIPAANGGMWLGRLWAGHCLAPSSSGGLQCVCWISPFGNQPRVRVQESYLAGDGKRGSQGKSQPAAYFTGEGKECEPPWGRVIG